MTMTRDHASVVVPARNSRLPLLKAAIRIFAEKGFEGAGIREIAEAAGVNSSLIYFHFGGKAELHAASLHLASRMARHTVKALPVPPPAAGASASRPAELRQAVTALRAYIRAFLRTSLRSGSSPPGEQDPGLEGAVLTLVAKAMIHPGEDTMVHVLEAIQPHREYLNRCLRVLRSDLDHDGLVRMGMSIHAQLLFFLCHQDLLSRLLSEPCSEDNLPRLEAHFTGFILNGLGIPDCYMEPESP